MGEGGTKWANLWLISQVASAESGSALAVLARQTSLRFKHHWPAHSGTWPLVRANRSVRTEIYAVELGLGPRSRTAGCTSPAVTLTTSVCSEKLGRRSRTSFVLCIVELLLNFVWLLLAVPACWLWRARVADSNRRGFSSRQGLLALGCLLVVLFPVISATDDLHAIRAEMEEPGISKRSVRQASQDKSSVKVSGLHNPPMILENAGAFALSRDGWRELVTTSSSTLAAASILRAGRAPPVFLLG